MAEQPQTEPGCISRAQGPFQAWLRPGQWCFGVRAIREGTEQWTVSCSKDELIQKLRQAVPYFADHGLVNTHKVRLGKVIESKGFVRIENYTQTAEWLDCVEFHISAVGNDACSVRVKSFSSGFMPTCIPLAPLLSAACCWFPFSDYTSEGSLNSARIVKIREYLVEQGVGVTLIA